MKTPPCQRARVLPEQKDYVADRTRSVTRPSRSWNLQWLQVSQQRIDIKVCNRCARLARSSILNKLNSFSGIDFTLAFRRGWKSAAFVAEWFSSGKQGQLAAYFVGFLLVPGGGLEPPRPCGLRILSPLRLPVSPSGRSLPALRFPFSPDTGADLASRSS